MGEKDKKRGETETNIIVAISAHIYAWLPFDFFFITTQESAVLYAKQTSALLF